MAARQSDVVEVVTMQLVLSDATVLSVTAELSFRAIDPYTVRASFTGPHSKSTWLIGRELLAQGLVASQAFPAGTGDVRVWRDDDPAFVLISLYHMVLGLTEVILDYVPHPGFKFFLMLVNYGFALAIAAACVFSLLRIAVGT